MRINVVSGKPRQGLPKISKDIPFITSLLNFFTFLITITSNNDYIITEYMINF